MMYINADNGHCFCLDHAKATLKKQFLFNLGHKGRNGL